jgi:hypothetical protein
MVVGGQMSIVTISFQETDTLDLGTGITREQVNALWMHLKTRNASYILTNRRLSRHEFINYFVNIINRHLSNNSIRIVVTGVPESSQYEFDQYGMTDRER